MTRRAAPLLGLILLVAPGAVRAQVQRGAVAGFVRDADRRSVRLAQLTIVGTDIRATSDSLGRYRLDGVYPGEVLIGVRRLGFAPDSAVVIVRSGETLDHDFALALNVAMLDAQSVVADPLRGKMAAFNERKARGIGSFITRADIEKRQPPSMSEMLRSVAGVSVTQKMAGEPQPVQMSRSTNSSTNASCAVQIYVDGHPYPSGSVDDFPPYTIEGVEVYRSASEIPAAFRTRDATCGIIALWTRDPEQRRP